MQTGIRLGGFSKMCSAYWEQPLAAALAGVTETPAGRRGPAYRFRGAAKRFQTAWMRPRGDGIAEVILSGPSETGKTLAALTLLRDLCWANPGLQAVLVRKTYRSMAGSVLETWHRKVLAGTGIEPFGGSKPEWYDFPNGSRVW